MAESTETEFASLDGTVLRGTVVRPRSLSAHGVVLVHGGGVTREEGGFFARIAQGLVDAEISSLRFDFRGHGTSGGRQEDLTLAGVANDVRAAVAHLVDLAEVESLSVLGASFGGGIAALFAAHHPERVRSLVLINPLFDYKRRLIDEKPYWSNDRIDPAAAKELAEHGFLRHSPSFKVGAPLLNELFYMRPGEHIEDLKAPTLILHGTADTFIPVESSREHIRRIPAETRLVEIEDAQHGIAVHDDPQYRAPQTQRWQAEAIDEIVRWVAGHSRSS
jgi:alpha-beta hydrolase superfamily lysophospholipase